jgi:hypothetical protein
MEAKLAITGDPQWVVYNASRIAEPGTCRLERTVRIAKARHASKDLINRVTSYCEKYTMRPFSTKIPTLDIRHGGNFTGHWRGRRRTWDLPPWGKFEDVMKG